MPKRAEKSKPIRAYVPNLTAAMRAVVCPHCHKGHDPKKLRVTNTYRASRRHICPSCGKPFISMLTTQ